MTDPLSAALSAVTAWLEEFGERYALVGGLAVVLRARPRLTLDIDLVVRIPRGSRERLLAIAAVHGLSWHAEELQELEDEGLLRLSHETSDARVGVDVMYSGDAATERLLTRASAVVVEGRALLVASIEDLILMKLEANRPQDLDDVLALRDAAGPSLDREYLRQGAVELDLVDRARAFLG